ncbi:uncharacterized protein EKO05_0005351 [Ascochyta rabiei]|uniref:uncharacterized protein n=1 Tax=Didymella rabiei TaxID=5454 RepID=UPI00220160B7|nr:uncharacterized protein EKO05_0005351 [Ascochyta rabiei]UPX14880.1 hypothetical protein EKO05_0005351 [Ascochyta rabiei]
MSFTNKLDPSSAAFIPNSNNQSETIEADYMNFLGMDFTSSFPELAMNIEPCISDPHPHKQEPFPSEQFTSQRQQGSSVFGVPAITLEKVQMDMYAAFTSFMQLQNEYQTKLQHVERELARNVQEAHDLRQDVDVLSNWAKAVLNHFGHEGTTKETEAVSKDQNSVV